MSDVFARAGAVILLAATLLSSACATQQDTIQQQKEQLQSLGATTRLIGQDWLAGRLSGTYTKTALEATFAQIEQQRATLAAKPAKLLDERAARLSQQAEELSRLVAHLLHDVQGADAAAARIRLAAIPILPDSR